MLVYILGRGLDRVSKAMRDDLFLEGAFLLPPKQWVILSAAVKMK